MAKLSDKLSQIVVTGNPQSAGIAGEIRPFAGDTSNWPVVNGVRQLRGWAVCEGNILNESDYPDLSTNLKGGGTSPWDNFAHPLGQTGTVGPGQFRLPKLNGLHLKSSGNNGNGDADCGDFQDQGTVSNNMTNDSYDHTHSRGTMNITGTVTMRADGNFIALIGAGADNPTGAFSGAGGSPSSTAQSKTNSDVEFGGFEFNAEDSWTGATSSDTHTHDLTSTDAETRPTSVAVSYIIALYNNNANVISTQNLSVSGDLTVSGSIIGGGFVARSRGADLTITSGGIQPTHSLHQIDTEGSSAADNLTTIQTVGVPEGTLITLFTADSARVVTVVDNAGNLRTDGNFVMDSDNDTITFIYAAGVWKEISRSNNA